MIPDRDIWRSAKLLIDEHGEDAVLEASSKIDAMLDAGDMVGRAVWKHILAAIKELQSTTRTTPLN